MARGFHLSPPGKGGVSCDADGAFIAAIPILNRLQKNGRDEWHPRDCEELSEEMGEHYGLPIDMSSKAAGLRTIANALNAGNVARAQIATVLLGIPDPPPLSKRDRTPDRMIELIRDLHWSGLLKWNPDEHPRWPAGSADSIGGRFAPKGEGGESDSTDRDPRAKLADAGMRDSADDPAVQAAARAANAARQVPPTTLDDYFDSISHAPETDAAPHTILAAAEGEDEREPGSSTSKELIPQRLQQTPGGPAVEFLDNLLDISGPGDEANLQMAELKERNLLHEIRALDPSYSYESIQPLGGLAAMSWQERLSVINDLQADLAAAIYRKRRDIKPLQEVTLDFMQRVTNTAYDEGVQKYNNGTLDVRLSRQEAIGNYVDAIVRARLNIFFNGLGIRTDFGSEVRINRRAYDTSGPDISFRLPDARIGNFAFEVSLTAKKSSDQQIRGFFNADFKPVAVVIIRPNQLSDSSSYIIWRPKGW